VNAAVATNSNVKFTATPKMGNGEEGMGNGEEGMGNGEQGTGNGEQGTGNREEGRVGVFLSRTCIAFN
jgi:hypothetical protein